MSDKRNVSTDALETLGTIISEGEKRDAIHLAVEPITAMEKLYPGQDVGLVEGGAGACDKPLGIVDPFLKAPVFPGQRFWLVVYPRQIHSLRHVWTHPAFPDEAGTPTEQAVSDDPKAKSQKWIEGFAERLDQTYTRLMSAAARWNESGDYTRDDSETYKDYWDEFPEFWKHYEIVTGEAVESKEAFFTCSC